MPSRIRVAVVFGGQSAEHSVSLQSARFVLSALDPQRYDVVPIGITGEGRFLVGGDPLKVLTGETPPSDATELAAVQAAPQVAGVDVVFPVLHGPHGEDGTLQGLLELAGVAYVGAGVLGSAVGMDKAMMKMAFAQAGLPLVPHRVLVRSELGDDALVKERLAGLCYPLFVKPANMGSSVGISKVESHEGIGAALNAASRHDRRIVVEQGVDAREIECGVLGNDHPEASVVGEVLSSHDFYDFQAKYDGTSRIVIPAAVPEGVAQEIRGYALRAFSAVDAAGMARVDFFLERSTGQVYVNEINTIPGFTPFSMFPLLWKASGIDFPDLCARLVDLALQRHAERNTGREAESPR